jgi:hypothetical protein
VHAALAAAARDRPSELRARRDGIIERLYAACGCSSCNARQQTPPLRAALAAVGLDEEDNGEEAAPASPEADGDAARAGSAEEEAEELGAGGGGELRLESKIMAIRDFLEDPDQVPKEAIFAASLREFATNTQFFHANCARLWCFVTA